jgi:hypothetical protein
MNKMPESERAWEEAAMFINGIAEVE